MLSLFFNQNHLNKSSTHSRQILNFRVHDGIIKQKEKKRENEWKEKVTLGWKPKKGSLKRKWEDSKDSWVEQTKEWRVNNQEASEASTRSSIPFENQKIGTFYSRMSFPNSWVYHGRSWHLSSCHIQRLKKINLFKDTWFSKNLFFLEKCFKRATLLLNQIVKINLLNQIIRFQVNALFGDF